MTGLAAGLTVGVILGATATFALTHRVDITAEHRRRRRPHELFGPLNKWGPAHCYCPCHTPEVKE